MKSKLVLHATTLALASLIVTSQAAKAAPEDCEFQLVENQVRPGSEAIVAVRLVDKRTGVPSMHLLFAEASLLDTPQNVNTTLYFSFQSGKVSAASRVAFAPS